MKFSTSVLSVAVAALSIVHSSTALPASGGRTLSFLGRVNIAVRQVQEKHPAALLQTVTGVSASGEPVGEGTDLDQLTLTFSSSGGQLSVKSTGYSSFGEAQTIGPNLIGVQNMKLEEDVNNMDLYTADGVIRAFGDENKYKKVVLSVPATKGKRQARYAFTTTNDVLLSVGTLDGQVDVAGA